MKKIIRFFATGLCLCLCCFQALSQNVSNNPSFLKHRTYKVYFGQNFLSCIYIDKAQLQNLIGAGSYKFYLTFADGNNQVSSDEENYLLNKINIYNPSNIGEIPNVACSDGVYPSLYGSFDISSDPKFSVVYNRRDGTFNDYINVIVKNITNGRYCSGSIAQVESIYTYGQLKDSNGMVLNFDLDRTNITSGHNNINAVGYNYDGSLAPTFNPAATQTAANHVFLKNVNSSTVAESGKTNNSNTTSTTIPLTNGASSQITYQGCTTCKIANTNDDGTVNVQITGLQGGGGRYEIFVPNTGEYITFPMTKNNTGPDCPILPSNQLVTIPYYVYYGQNADEVSLMVKLKPNQSNEIRVRSAFNYDDKMGNNWMENGVEGHFAWDSNASFLTNVANVSYTSFNITPTTNTTPTTTPTSTPTTPTAPTTAVTTTTVTVGSTTINLQVPASLCSGQSITITQTGCNFNYNWAVNGSPVYTNKLIISPSSTTDIRLTCYVPSGNVDAKATYTPKVCSEAPPAISIQMPSATCAGQSVTFAQMGCNYNYSWAVDGSPVFTNNLIISPKSATNIRLTCYIPSGNVDATATYTPLSCTSPAPVTPAVATPPAVSIQIPTTTCAGQSITFTQTGCNYNYSWAVDGSPVFTNNLIISPKSATNIRLTCYVPTGNVDVTATYTPKVCAPTPPNISIQVPTATCAGQSVTFTQTGCTYNYNWVVNGSPIYTNNLIISPTSATNIRLTCYIPTGNVDATTTYTPKVCAPSPPNISIQVPTATCAGQMVTFTQTGCAYNYYWVVNNNTIYAGSLSISPTSATNVRLTCFVPTGNIDENATYTPKSCAPATPIPTNIYIQMPVATCPGQKVTFVQSGCTFTHNWTVDNKTISTDSLTIAPISATNILLTCITPSGNADIYSTYTPKLCTTTTASNSTPTTPTSSPIPSTPVTPTTSLPTNVNIQMPVAMCTGQNVTFVQTGCAYKHSWTVNDKAISTDSLIIAPTSATNIRLTCITPLGNVDIYSAYTPIACTATGIKCPSDGAIVGQWNVTNYMMIAKVVNQKLWLTLTLPTNDKVNFPQLFGATDAFFVIGRNMLQRTDVTLAAPAFANIASCFAGGDTGMNGINSPTDASPFNPTLVGYTYFMLDNYQMPCYKKTSTANLSGTINTETTESTIINESVEVDKNDFALNLHILQNPTNDKTEFTFSSQIGSTYQVTLSDLLGKQNQQTNMEGTGDTMKGRFNLAGQSDGLYLLNVTDGTYRSTKKIIKIGN